MSRSQNVDVKNPSQKFFTWKGSTGTLTYWNNEAKENVEVPLPFQFLVLDRLVTISGYSDEDNSGFWSNEIYNTQKEILTVRTKNGIKKQGLYEEIKTVTGAKYCQSLYVAFYDENKELAIGNIKLSGCGVSAWIEFSKGKDIYKGAIGITDKLEGKKGATVFFSPVFEQKENVSPEANLAATSLDGELQEYLSAYFAVRQSEPETPDDYIAERNKEIESFEAPKAAAAVNANTFGSSHGEHFKQEEIDDSSIPF